MLKRLSSDEIRDITNEEADRHPMEDAETEGTGVEPPNLDEAELFAKIPEIYQDDPRWDAVRDLSAITEDDWDIIKIVAGLDESLDNSQPDKNFNEEVMAAAQRIREQRATMRPDEADRSNFYDIINQRMMKLMNPEYYRRLKKKERV